MYRGALVVPVRDAAGDLHGLQFIGASGTKRFLKDTAVQGHYFQIGETGAASEELEIVCVAEGFAIGASIHEATRHPVAVAFHAGNLAAVAKAIRDEYLTDLLTARALDYIERRAAEPFFLSVHYTAPHFSWQTRDGQPLPRDTAGGLFHLDGGNVSVYQRMIHHTDEDVSRIVAALCARGLDGSTLVVFTSDNGGEHFSDNWSLMGGNDCLFNLAQDARERADLALRQPGRLAAMRTAWEDWNAALPPIPVDAGVSLGYSVRAMPQR